MKRLLNLFLMITFLASTAHANAIQTACLNSNRAAGNFVLCGCIQGAANQTLTARDQKLAASFFKDPHRAQEIRQSSRRTHESFWKRYRSFTNAAETYCSR